MEMLGKVRRMHYRDGLSRSKIARRTGLSRTTVKKWLRAGEEVEPRYRRESAPGKLSPFHEVLLRALEADAQRPKRDRRIGKALFAELKVQGYAGGYTVLSQFGLDGIELLTDGLDERLDAGASSLVADGQALTFGHQHRHQLPAPGHQRLQRLLLGGGQRLDELVPLGVAHQHLRQRRQGARVDAIGLGQVAHGAGEIARLARIDHRHGEAGRLQRTGQPGRRRLAVSPALEALRAYQRDDHVQSHLWRMGDRVR
jgi:transposase